MEFSFKYKEYKIWRFAYTSYEDKLLIPEGVKLYCFNKNRKETLGHLVKDKGFTVWNEHWIAVLPYSKEMMKFSNHKNQTYSLSAYNLNDKYIIWDLEQIYPLCDDFPETTELPNISNEYIKYAATNISFSNEVWKTELDRIDSLNLSNDEREQEIKNKFMPIVRYVKINGFRYESIDLTTITVKSAFDGSELMDINRKYEPIDFVFNKVHENIFKSDNEEFTNILNEQIFKMTN